MIAHDNGIFRLTTDTTSYWFRVTAYGHLEHIYYGPRIADQPIEGLLHKVTNQQGTSVLYDPENALYCLDTLPLEWSGIGCGDYRMPAAEIEMPDGSFTSDFRYECYRILSDCTPASTLPCAYGEAETLEIALKDRESDVELFLYYTVFSQTDVIARRAVLKNSNAASIRIRRLMSLSIDLPDRSFSMVTFDGGWIREAHRHDRRLQYGIYINSSTTGNSSNRHNPGFLLFADGAGETHGTVYGFNLIYSGNHYGAAERSIQELVRVQTGIQPQGFSWILKQDEIFETPQAIMSCTDRGFDGLSDHFHRFINEHIVRGDWKDRERPIVYNCWEPCFFDFTEAKLLRLARQAKRLGMETFVLDDGWFGARNNDHAGLGDYTVNKKKFPHGLSHFQKKLANMGLDFGIWMEPEMVNEDSDLYRAHPEYAIRTPNRKPTTSRNQLVLDLCNPDVRDYIVEQVGNILDTSGASYVKWDMNRHISDAYSSCIEHQGEFSHRYILGLYEILTRIFTPRPHILLESCASGGNRFDLGMLCFSPQIWASDDTDPGERLKIQGGLSHLYPPSTWGAHVSDAPHQQTLRNTPLATRYHAACFGCLGYEMDLRFLSPMEKREIREQVDFYKKHRRTFQFGRFRRLPQRAENKVLWSSTARDQSECTAALFQTQTSASSGQDRLYLDGLDADTEYVVETRPQRIAIKSFGGLIRHVLPFTPNPDGWLLHTVNKFYGLSDCREQYTLRGDALKQGLALNTAFCGSYYNNKTRLLGDFGSNMYLIRKTAVDA